MGKPKAPAAETTPLDGLTNEQLLAMLTPINHDRAVTLSEKLGKAATEITKIAEYLRARASGGLSWQGKGADAFTEWTAATASATFYLAEYTELASKALSYSAQAMAEAKSGVDELAKSSASAKTNYASAQRALNAARHDPEAGKTEVKSLSEDMNAAATLRERTRIEALMKLRSLGQTYTHTGQQVNSAPRPEFPPPAGMNDAWREKDTYVQVPGRASTSSTSSTRGVMTADKIGGRPDTGSDSGTVRGSDGTVDHGGTVRPTPTHVVPPDPEIPADLGIDSVITHPDVPTVPTTPPGPGTVKPDVPTTFPGGNQFTPPPLITGPTGPGPLPTTGGTAKGLPGGRPGPFGPGGTTAGRLPRETGIFGGKPTPTNGGRPTTGIPRSNVIGNEQTYGRGGTSGATQPHAGRPGERGMAAGRRLATEQGGVVGGKAQKAGQAGAKPFTPGGSGLVRGGQSGAGTGPVAGRGAGIHGAGARNGADDRDERNGERPDYLVEDEETWQQGRRPIVPPVVD
ncbi:hypothetical protein ACIGO8_16595 [Streptomyces sp. NPDC053493]|uniref:hypothetical protein n=1 Tax=Streptomyces sp. NPDC053493 TaxID=3365705 RepID=UPI0037D395A1